MGNNSYTRYVIIIRTLTWIRNQLTVLNSGGTDLPVRAPMKQLRIPPLLVDIIQSGILACEGVVFDSRDACPVCGGPVSGYDTRKKQFAVMLREGIPYPLHVLVKRFCCRQCGLISFADEPFYPGNPPRKSRCRPVQDTLDDYSVSPCGCLHGTDGNSHRSRDSTELCPWILSGNPDLRSLRGPYSPVGDFTLFSHCRGGGSHQRGRSARCLWFPIRIPGSA